MAAALLKALRIAALIVKDMLQNEGSTLAKVVLGVITLFFGFLMMVLIPVAIYERVPVTPTTTEALWYYLAAQEVTVMTQTPCDSGVYVDWQEVIAIDALRYKQDFHKSSPDKAKDLARRFVQKVGSCSTGGENEKTYPIYRLRTIEEVMDDLGMSQKEQETVISKYRVIDFNFLIGFDPAAGKYGELYSGELSWPVPGYHSISSPYGQRLHPVKKVMTMHYGIDIPAPKGASIIAPADGRVKAIYDSAAEGLTMEVDHGKNENGQHLLTRYCHLSSTILNPGQEVMSGKAVAKVGNTGYLNTGSHLHFEVQVDGVCQDPAGFFKTDE